MVNGLLFALVLVIFAAYRWARHFCTKPAVSGRRGTFSALAEGRRLQTLFPALSETGQGRMGLVDGFMMTVDRDGRSLSIDLGDAAPKGLELTPATAAEGQGGVLWLTGDRAFDRHFRVGGADAALLAYFDLPTRRRLLQLERVSFKDGVLQLVGGDTLGHWLQNQRGLWRSRLNRTSLQRSMLRPTPFNTTAWLVEELLTVARHLADSGGLAPLLRLALAAETMRPVRQRLAALWCDCAAQGRLADESWPEIPIGKGDWVQRFLFVRSPAQRSPARLAALMADCPAQMRPAFLRELGRFEAATQLAVLKQGMDSRDGFVLAVLVAEQLQDPRARQFLAEQINVVCAENRHKWRALLPTMLRALGAKGPHMDSEAVLELCLRRGHHARVCFEVLAEIGSVAAVGMLAQYRREVNPADEGSLEQAILALQVRHGLVPGGHAGALSIVGGDNAGGLSLAEDPVVGRISIPEDPS